MERQFRGKRVNDGEWVFGWLLNDTTIGEVGAELNHYNYSTVIPSSVGQATGLKDSEGVDVYENDIFDFGAGWIDVVKWHDKSCGFGLYCPERKEWDDYQLYKTSLEGSTTYILKKIIGNVTDNPNLVKGEE